VVVGLRRADGNGDVQRISPPDERGAADHARKTVADGRHFRSAALREDGQKFLMQPAADEIRGTESFFDGLRHGAKSDIDRCLAVTFAQLGKIVDGDAQHAEGNGINVQQAEALVEVRVDHGVVEKAGESVKAADSGEFALTTVVGLAGIDADKNLHGALHGIQFVAKRDSMHVDGDQISAAAAERRGGIGGVAIANGVEQRGSAETRIVFEVQVLEEFFAAVMAEDILTEVTGEALGACAPQANFAGHIDDTKADRQGLDNETVEVLVQKGRHVIAGQERSKLETKNEAERGCKHGNFLSKGRAGR
jgi:hypothetical protein